jgi:predicted TPR repeat methyltransferase
MPFQSLRRVITHAAFSSPLVANAATALTRRRTSAPSATTWDSEYERGAYDRLEDLDELAHHAVIAGYVARLNPGARVLDIGCGTGTTEKLLRRCYTRYHGVDFSAVAVAKARENAPNDTRFAVADANDFIPDGVYDVVIMSEVVEYFRDLEEQIRRYAGCLSPNGHLIVSIWASRRNLALWPCIDNTLRVRDEVLLWNARRQGWIVKLYSL